MSSPFGEHPIAHRLLTESDSGVFLLSPMGFWESCSSKLTRGTVGGDGGGLRKSQEGEDEMIYEGDAQRTSGSEMDWKG